jgi:DNA ligase-1
MKKFKPFLAPNQEVDVQELPYPLLASFKLDGIRCIFKDGRMISRSLKDIPNKRLQDKFKKLKGFTKTEPKLKPILDGELLAKSLPFNDLSGLVRTFDKEPPDDLFFHIFDTLVEDKFDEPFVDRLKRVEKIGAIYPELIRIIPQRIVTNPEETKEYFYFAVEQGCDGLILRHPMGKYKCGRGTIKEGLIYKLKPFVTFDAKIIDVIQATMVDPNAEKKINELGYSETSKKLGDRIPIEKASAFVVLHEGDVKLKVVIAMTDKEKEEIWRNRDNHIGKWIEYKGLMVGSKDLPRHPVMIRFRNDKE